MDNLDIPKDEELVQFSDLNIPNIASIDPEERKIARRVRIKKRVEALAKLAQQQVKEGEEVAAEEKQPEKTLLQFQLERSSEILKELFLNGEELVTNLRVANDAREVDRREDETLNRESVIKQLDEEACLAGQMFDEIASKWANILKYRDPLAINDDIGRQKAQCDELIKQKDTLIAMLRNEVKMAEIKFYKDQKDQNEDISRLAKRVEKQVATMRAAHRTELQTIEDVMIQERNNMMENNDKKWEELYKKREEQEMAISNNKLKQKNEFEVVVSNVRTKHYEFIREVKIRLERDCEQLQQEYETIKAAALAYREKMDYNYQILRKREDENIIIKSDQKRKLNKLRDIINDQRKKTHKFREKTEYTIKKLCSEIVYLQKAIAGVRAKSETLSVINEQKYMQVWELNKNIAVGILNKLITIDRLLHEQQMGLHWEKPALKLLKKENLQSYVQAVQAVATLKDKTRPSVEEPYVEGHKNSLAYKNSLLNVLNKIAQRSSFLIEYRLRNLLGLMSSDEGDLIKVDNVFSGLGITSNDELDLMYTFFKPYVTCPICTALKGTDMVSETTSRTEDNTTDTLERLDSKEVHALQAVCETYDVVKDIVASVVKPERLEECEDLEVMEGECLGPLGETTTKKSLLYEQNTQRVSKRKFDPMDMRAKTSRFCNENHSALAIESGYILRALKDFVNAAFCSTSESKTEQNDVTISRLMKSEDVALYWDRFKLVLGEKKFQMWDALFYSLQKYHSILEDRHKLHEKLMSVRRQNSELQHLLKRYRIDEPLQPPCAQQREQPIKTNESKANSCK